MQKRCDEHLEIAVFFDGDVRDPSVDLDCFYPCYSAAVEATLGPFDAQDCVKTGLPRPQLSALHRVRKQQVGRPAVPAHPVLDVVVQHGVDRCQTAQHDGDFGGRWLHGVRLWPAGRTRAGTGPDIA